MTLLHDYSLYSMVTQRWQPTCSSPAPRRRCHFKTAARAAQAGQSQQNVPALAKEQVAGVTRSQLLKSALLVAATAAVPQMASAAETSAATAATAAVTAPATAAGSLSKVVLRTLSDCQLAVSVYPTFSYNAGGGGGRGAVTQQPDGLLHVSFDAASLHIPAIQYSTTTILGVPIPPPLKIQIVPRRLEGTVDPATGHAELDFLADFKFTALPLYAAPPLVVGTTLTTEKSEGVLRQGQGKRMNGDGKTRLVGVARVPKTGDGFLDNFLMLPTDALAVLSAEIEFS